MARFAPTSAQVERHRRWVENYAAQPELKDVDPEVIRRDMLAGVEGDWLHPGSALAVITSMGDHTEPREYADAVRTAHGIGSVRWARICAQAMGLTIAGISPYWGIGRDRSTAYVYRIYDDEQTLLYIGSSSNPMDRLGGHEQQSRWWEFACDMTVDAAGSRHDAYDAERAAIIAEQPLFNLNGTTDETRELAGDYRIAEMLT